MGEEEKFVANLKVVDMEDLDSDRFQDDIRKSIQSVCLKYGINLFTIDVYPDFN